MKNLIFILTQLCFLQLKIVAQVSQQCDVTIEWNLDDQNIKKSLPYNQSICFNLKSEKINLDKITSVWLLEHRGAKDNEASLDYYTNSHFLGSSNLLGKKFSRLKKDEYDAKNKILVVKVDANHVLQPSNSYSIYLFTSDPNKNGSQLLYLIKQYIYASDNKTSDTTKIKSKIKSQDSLLFTQVRLSKITSFITDYLDINKDSNATSLIKEYRENIIKYDHSIDTVTWSLDSLYKFSKTGMKCFSDSITFFIQRNLSLIIKNNGCTSEVPCIIDRCSLYKILMPFNNEYKALLFDSIVKGKIALFDLSNILYKENQEINEIGRSVNIDSSLIQLASLKLYLSNLFFDDCKKANCCDSLVSKTKLSALNDGIKIYLNCIDVLLDRLNKSKKLLINLAKLKKEKDEAIKSADFFIITEKINASNTQIYGLEERTKFYVVPSFGYAFYGFQKGFTNFTPYTALVIGLAPLNDSIPFQHLRRKTFAQRLTFLTGITLSTFKESNKRDNLFGNGTNLIVGLGLKLSHIISIDGGVICFKKENPNPFITTKKVAATPFASFSINLKLKTLWEGFTNLLPVK